MKLRPDMILVNNFALRHTENSPHSHFTGLWSELIILLTEGEVLPGYREGVIRVVVRPEGFFTGIIEASPDVEMEASLCARSTKEAPYIRVLGKGPKMPARHVEIILYTSAVLAEDGDQTPGAAPDDWEIVSINASPTDTDVPMTPLTMARNFLHLPGGTQGTYTAEEFAQSIVFWSSHLSVRG